MLAKSALNGPVTSIAGSDSYAIERNDLNILVTASGEVESRFTTNITSQVEGRSTIIYLIEEGSILTEEDVKNGTVLVELDSSGFKEKYLQKDMSYSNAQANYEEAWRNYEIQVQQNISDITAAKLKEEFALMDFKKYVGKQIAEQLLAESDGNQGDVTEKLDVHLLESDENSKGEALQVLRDLRNSIEKAQEDIQRAHSKFEGTTKLFENGYVTRMELDADQAAYNQQTRNLVSKKTSLQLFLKYDFYRNAKQFYRNYEEAKRQTRQAEIIAKARLAQAEIKRTSAEVKMRREKESLERVKKSLDACIIRASAPGLVVYGRERNRRRQNVVEVGAEVRQRQKLLTIPSANDMAVKLKVQEAWIDKVKVDQRVLISLDAYPDKVYTGTIIKVASLPNAVNWWSDTNDAKVYEAIVSIHGIHDEIRDGMSTKVEIMADQRKNVLTVPVQAVANVGNKKICYLIQEDGKMEIRDIEVGIYNDKFIEIIAGLNEGDLISLKPKRQNLTINQMELEKNALIELVLQSRINANTPVITQDN